MNRALIEGWNETVDAADDVWVLGGFALGKINDTLRLASELRGREEPRCHRQRGWECDRARAVGDLTPRAARWRGRRSAR